MTTLFLRGLALLTCPRCAVALFPVHTGSGPLRPGLFAFFPALLAGVLLATSGATLAAPILTGISPASGPTAGGTLITLTGQDFSASPTVMIGGLAATVQPGGSATSVVVSLPAGEGTNLQVVLDAGGIYSNALAFSYLPPAISGVSPGTGPTQGGTTLTVTGSNFGLNPSVFVGPSFAPVISTSHTQLTCILPAGQGQNVQLVVFVGGQLSAAASFSYTAPAITSLSPANGPVAGGTPITINGSNFGTSPVVTFDGVVVPSTADAVTPHNKLHITSPSGSGTARKIAVVASGQLSNSVSFNYDGPTLYGINPATGSTSGNFPVTLTGANFGLNPVVTVNGVGATVLPGASDGSLVFTFPAGQGSGREVRIMNSERQYSSIFFSHPPPSITGLSPTSAPTSGNVPITITGQNFGTSPTVTLGGNPVALVSATHSEIVFTLPQSFSGGTNLPVIVQAGDQISAPSSFSYDLAPVITSISPATGTTQGGYTLTLNGSHFGVSPTVFIGGSFALVTASTSTQVTVIVPAGQGQNREVRLTVNGVTSGAVTFSYTAPAITALSATNGPIAGGTPITITGSNFGLAPVVTFDGVVVPNIADAVTPHNKLSITSPPGSGTGRKIAVMAGGQFSNSVSFNYDGPILYGISPATGPTLGGTSITLTGSNFGLTSTVSIGGENAPLLAGSVEGSLIVALPAGQGAGNEMQITSAERQSSIAFFSYIPPSITSISPTSAPSSGNVPITIAGQNFGISPAVTLGGMPVAIVSSSHSEIVFTLPPSFAGGTNLPVVVFAGNQTSNTGTFSYVLPVLTDTTDTDSDGLNDATERQLSMYGFDRLVAQPSLISSFLTGNTLYNPTQYAANRTAGQTDVTSAPNGYGLYTLSQVQALHVGAPLLQRDGLGQFKVTLGIEKSTTLQPTSFQPFPMTAPQTTVNGAGELEFLFTVPDNAAFFRLEAQ